MPYDINILRKAVLLMNTWYIEFSEGTIEDNGADYTRRCLTTIEALSDFLHDKYGDTLCMNGIPAFIEASAWAENACIDEEATFILDVDDDESHDSFELTIRSAI